MQGKRVTLHLQHKQLRSLKSMTHGQGSMCLLRAIALTFLPWIRHTRQHPSTLATPISTFLLQLWLHKQLQEQLPKQLLPFL